MFRKLVMAGACAALAVALFADVSQAGIFRRNRQRCRPVVVYYYPCQPAPAARAPLSPEAALAEMEALMKVINQPLQPLPKGSAAVEKALGGAKK
jgi:hypothetical protein